MADALDEFVVDGIEHNMPFLSALMQHPRWREGRLSTGFIAEEFPDGFHPIKPDQEGRAVLAAIATAVELFRRDRLDRLERAARAAFGRAQARLGGEARRRVCRGRRSSREWFRSRSQSIFRSAAAQRSTVASGWRPGDPVWRGTVGGPQDFGAGAAAAQWRPPRLEGHVGDGARHAADGSLRWTG